MDDVPVKPRSPPAGTYVCQDPKVQVPGTYGCLKAEVILRKMSGATNSLAVPIPWRSHLPNSYGRRRQVFAPLPSLV